MSLTEVVNSALAQGLPYLEQWGALAVGIGIMCETLLAAGLFIPGFSILIAAGYLAAGGTLDPLSVLCAATLGGLAGDQAAFALGRYAGLRLVKRRMQRAKRLWDAVQAEGTPILLWYHFVSPMRMVMPCLAGSMGFAWRRWLLFDSLGLVFWIVTGFGIGYLAHGPLQQLGSTGLMIVVSFVSLLIAYTVWRMLRLLLNRRAAVKA